MLCVCVLAHVHECGASVVLSYVLCLTVVSAPGSRSAEVNGKPMTMSTAGIKFGKYSLWWG